jgi:hypothetical protein
VRKVLPDGGAALGRLFEALAAELDARADADVIERFSRLRELTARLASAAREVETLPHETADDYLRAVGLALFGWAWRLIERTPGADAPRWRQAAAAARLRILPEFDMRMQILHTQCGTARASVTSA